MPPSSGGTEAVGAIVESPYGSDQAGLVWAYAFTAGVGGRSINRDEAAALLARLAAGPVGGEFVVVIPPAG